MIVNIKKINNIRDNYPTIWKWMRDKASWEHMTLGAVLNNYEEYIDELIKGDKTNECR